MKKKVEMTEGQFDDFFYDNYVSEDDGSVIDKVTSGILINCIKVSAIEKGYIKKSELEIAKENYYKKFDEIKKTMPPDVIYPEYKIYIQLLEKALEKKLNE